MVPAPCEGAGTRFEAAVRGEGRFRGHRQSLPDWYLEDLSQGLPATFQARAPMRPTHFVVIKIYGPSLSIPSMLYLVLS